MSTKEYHVYKAMETKLANSRRRCYVIISNNLPPKYEDQNVNLIQAYQTKPWALYADILEFYGKRNVNDVVEILAKFWRGPDKNEYEDIREYGAEFLKKAQTANEEMKQLNKVKKGDTMTNEENNCKSEEDNLTKSMIAQCILMHVPRTIRLRKIHEYYFLSSVN